VSAAQVQRCGWCKKYDLPCGDLTHDNVLARYVPLMNTTELSVGMITGPGVPVVPGHTYQQMIVPGEPVVRMSHPAEHYDRARRRADRLSAVAILILILVAFIVAIGLFLAAVYLEPSAGWDHQPFAPAQTPYPTPNPEVSP
jgi:hypothetical protein